MLFRSEEKKKRLYRQKEWLNEQIYHRLREFGTVLDLSNITDEETVVKLADRINAAYEPIIQSPVDTWPCFKRIKRAKEMYQQEEIDRLIGEIKNGTKSISIALDWHKKKKEIKNLELMLLAAKLIPNDKDPEYCPLCLKPLEPDSELQHNLAAFRDLDEDAYRSIGEIISKCCDVLRSQLPECINLIPDEPLDTLIKSDFEQNVGRFLNDALNPIRNLGTLKIESSISSIKLDAIQLKELEDLDVTNNKSFLESSFKIIKKIELLMWSIKNIDKFIAELNRSLGFEGNSKEKTMIGKLSNCKNIAISAKPLQKVMLDIDKIINYYVTFEKVSDEIRLIAEIKESLKELESLKNISDYTLSDELQSINDRMQQIYDALYGSKEYPLKSIQSKRIGRKIEFKFLVERDGIVIEAPPLINSSRIRALLWSYIFALAELRQNITNSNWLDFFVLDDPLTSFDEGHRIRFAKFVFDDKQENQWIISSHDTGWPRDIKQWGLKPRINRIRSLSCVRNVVDLTNWKNEVEERLDAWSKDSKNEILARDFVESIRIWLEQDLKDLLIFCPTSPRQDDDLNGLLNKMEKRIQIGRAHV